MVVQQQLKPFAFYHHRPQESALHILSFRCSLNVPSKGGDTDKIQQHCFWRSTSTIQHHSDHRQRSSYNNDIESGSPFATMTFDRVSSASMTSTEVRTPHQCLRQLFNSPLNDIDSSSSTTMTSTEVNYNKDIDRG